MLLQFFFCRFLLLFQLLLKPILLSNRIVVRVCFACIVFGCTLGFRYARCFLSIFSYRSQYLELWTLSYAGIWGKMQRNMKQWICARIQCNVFASKTNSHGHGQPKTMQKNSLWSLRKHTVHGHGTQLDHCTLHNFNLKIFVPQSGVIRIVYWEIGRWVGRQRSKIAEKANTANVQHHLSVHACCSTLARAKFPSNIVQTKLSGMAVIRLSWKVEYWNYFIIFCNFHSIRNASH